jgi:hypothetical protein
MFQNINRFANVNISALLRPIPDGIWASPEADPTERNLRSINMEESFEQVAELLKRSQRLRRTGQE